MSKEDMKTIKDKTETTVQNMLEQLPPEMREQAKLAMEQKQGLKKSSSKAVATGKRMNKYGFMCDEYMQEKSNKLITIWASNDRRGLAKKVKTISDKLSELFPSMDDEDKSEWELVSGKIPIEVRTYQMNPMAGAKMEIQAITKINETKPPAKKFIPPGAAEGFTRSSFKEMMNPMMQGKRAN